MQMNISKCEQQYRFLVYENILITSRPFLKNGGRYCFRAVAVSAVRFLKLGMYNICKNNIAKMFLDFFKILNCSFDIGFFNSW